MRNEEILYVLCGFFTEISNVTADEEQLKKSRDRMAELGLLTEKWKS